LRALSAIGRDSGIGTQQSVRAVKPPVCRSPKTGSGKPLRPTENSEKARTLQDLRERITEAIMVLLNIPRFNGTIKIRVIATP